MTPATEELRILTAALADTPEPQGKYRDIIGRKSSWTPAPLESQLKSSRQAQTMGSLGVVQRCVALALELEVPVGLYTADASSREVPQDIRWALLHNSKDELTHLEAFQNAAATLEVPVQFQEEAKAIAQSFLDFQGHPIFMAGFIELGLFFPTLSMLRRFGDTALKLLVNDVSRDEATHVLTNWSAIDDLRVPNHSHKLQQVRREAIQWLTQGLQLERWGADFWVSQSDQLIENRRASGLDFTRVGMSVSFFEVSNRNLAYYS